MQRHCHRLRSILGLPSLSTKPPPSPVFSFRSLARLRPTVLPKVPFVQHLLLSASSCSARPWPAASLVQRRSAAKWGN